VRQARAQTGRERGPGADAESEAFGARCVGAGRSGLPRRRVQQRLVDELVDNHDEVDTETAFNRRVFNESEDHLVSAGVVDAEQFSIPAAVPTVATAARDESAAASEKWTTVSNASASKPPCCC